MAKVVGYTITEDILELDNDNISKPVLNVLLERDGSNNIEIFDMHTYGLHFSNSTLNGEWTRIRLVLVHCVVKCDRYIVLST